MLHSESTSIHKGRYIQTSDPGAVGTGVEWLDTNTSPAIHKKRNAANDGWDEILDPADYATLASPALTGTPTAPTAAASTNTTQIATTAFVVAEIAASGGASALDDLSDVDTTGVASGDVLTYDGSDWVPEAPGGGAVIYDSGALGAPANAIDSGAASIPGTYRVIEVWFMGRTDGASGNINIRVNNDSGNNYHRQFVRGVDSTASAAVGASESAWFVAATGTGNTASNAGIIRLTIPFYAGTTFYKIGEITAGNTDTGNNTLRRAEAVTAVWASTSAITRIAVSANAGLNLIAGSRLVVFGR